MNLGIPVASGFANDLWATFWNPGSFGCTAMLVLSNDAASIWMNVAYALSMAAHHVTIGPEWHDGATLSNQRLLTFKKKVTVKSHPETRMSESELLRKFWHNAARVLTSETTGRVAETFRRLVDVDHLADLTRMWHRARRAIDHVLPCAISRGLEPSRTVAVWPCLACIATRNAKTMAGPRVAPGPG